MLRRRGWLALSILGAAVVAVGSSFVYLKLAPRRTPGGQPPLAAIPDGDLSAFERAFDAAAGSTRIVAMLSPT